MNYYLYKLRFYTAVHLGNSDSALSLQESRDSFCADTLFSALCHSALALGGTERLERLCEQAGQGQLLLSDAFPWHNETLYLPKPYMHPVLRTRDNSEDKDGSRKRKAMKKLAWIAIKDMSVYLSSVSGKKEFPAEEKEVHFGQYAESTKVAISGMPEPMPYQVGLYEFNDGCGLYFMAGCETDEQQHELYTLLKGLGLSGIGGKVTSGYGKFTVEEPVNMSSCQDEQIKWLVSSLADQDSKRFMLLSTSLPVDEELDEVLKEAAFQLTRRGGFVQSPNYSKGNLKKKTQFFMAAGSTVSRRFKPHLYSVGHKDRHPVYRLSAPIFLGV